MGVNHEYTGFWIDAAIAERPDLTNATKLLLGMVAGMVKAYGACEATSGYMSTCLDLSCNTVDSGLATLERKGLIERRTRRRPRWTKRTILLGEAYPKKDAAVPKISGGDTPKNRWSLDSTLSTIRDEDGVASRLPRSPLRSESSRSSAKPVAPAAPKLLPVPAIHLQMVQDWSAQVLTFAASADGVRQVKAPGVIQVRPASASTAADPEFFAKM